MAMSMKGHVLLPATREVVWDRLNDPATLKACIPGCQSLERTGENAFAAVAKVKVGPVNATFRGNVELSDLDPPNGYRISGGGEGGIAGFAKGNARVTLADTGEGCQLEYDVEANVGGKLAQMGSRLIDSVAKKTADQFFTNFAGAVIHASQVAAPESVGGGISDESARPSAAVAPEPSVEGTIASAPAEPAPGASPPQDAPAPDEGGAATGEAAGGEAATAPSRWARMWSNQRKTP
jgi:carbon monoxide dehydrogenase subunit G